MQGRLLPLKRVTSMALTHLVQRGTHRTKTARGRGFNL